MNQQAVTVRFQSLVRAHDRFRRGSLHESACLGVEPGPQKVVGRGVTNLEMNCRIEFAQLNQIGFAKIASLLRGLCRERCLHQLRDRTNGFDVKLIAGLGFDVAAWK